ncbi:heme oxygenase (biliverdin-producing) [Nocardioides caldifontis]|uniref:biliverdin-producing heme oxygenase n=1 Tax=Nocardioides caldifontis TaxID=2588938 RepID=UPI0011E02667|nr:biliverdin-producing heme oxygenase [Nocardioides caldifontis]
MTAATVDETTAQQPLSALLREGSRTEHEAAESETFVSELLAGRVEPAAYLAFLLRLVAVYRALESVGATLAADPVAGPVVDPALHRGPALAEDVAHWWVAAGRAPHALDLDLAVADAVAQSPATRAYVDRVHASASWGGLYVAHHYTRYLGDLSGGQAMGRVLSRTFDLEHGEGVRFFSFDAVPKTKPYKDRYRARLDALPVDAAGRDRMLAEVRAAFALNGAIFQELDATLPGRRA